MITVLRSLLLVMLIVTALSTDKSYGQSKHAYLLDCFSKKAIDTFETEIDNIGEIVNYGVESENVEDVGMIYYDIPKSKQSISLKRLVTYAANRQISTWKNNSKIIYNKQTEVDGAIISDVRLHLLIEDIYMQVIVVCEKEKVYEISCIRDKNEAAFFDKLTDKVRKKKCF